MVERVYKNDSLIKTLKYDKGKLTEVEKDGKIDISYDSYGNIKSIGSRNITYNKQNLISSICDSVNNIHYEYNYQGLRTKKIKENEYEVTYYLDKDRIIGEDKKTFNDNKIISKFRYYYDVNGISGIEYIDSNGKSYYYNLLKDLVGNVSKVMINGKLVGEYIYDAWGNIERKAYDEKPNEIDIYVINNNPFTYKGYYYDVESKVFYCNARYYSPELYCYLSPDDIEYLDPESINGLNLYCYCANNHIMNIDPTGHAWYH